MTLKSHEGRGFLDYLIQIQHHGKVETYAGKNGVPIFDPARPLADQIRESDAFKAYADSLIESGDTTPAADSVTHTFKGVDETTQKARVAMFTDADLDAISPLAGSLFSAGHDTTAVAALKIASGELPLVADSEVFDLDLSRARALIQSTMREGQINKQYQLAMGMSSTAGGEHPMDALEKANLEAVARARSRGGSVSIA